MENEMMQLKQHVFTQRELLKGLLDGVYLEILSKESIESLIEESVDSELSPPSMLDVHINAISETLDDLLSENRLDEALLILEMEAETLKVLCSSEDASPQLFICYNSTLAEKKSRLADQFSQLADHPRVAAAEFQKALEGLCRLGESHRTTQLLLKFYHLRLANGINDMQCSKPFLHEAYIREFGKFFFSVISQAARSFVHLYGETSPYASEFMQWACEEMEVFACCFGRSIRSISEINGGLSTAVQAMQHALSFCSLLETQRIVLQPLLIKLIRPYMEEVLQMHIDHLKKVIGIFASTDTWILGRFLAPGNLNEIFTPLMVGQQLEYCLLTNSGRKFITLLQATLEVISPLLILQMEGLILKGFADLFKEYINMLERAITSKTNVFERGGSRIILAEKLSQQFSVLTNASTLISLFSIVTESILKDVKHFNGKLMADHAMGPQLEELNSSMSFINEASDRLRSSFCKCFIDRVMHPKVGASFCPEIYIGGQGSVTVLDWMPSACIQVLFLELRKLEKLGKDDYVGVGWSVEELLRDLMKAFLVWLSNNQDFWATIEESSVILQAHGLKQFVLDMQFLVEITRFGEYFSNEILNGSLVLISQMESIFFCAGLDPNSDIHDNEWALNIAVKAIEKLLQIERTELQPTEDTADVVKAEADNNQLACGSDSFEDDARSFSEISNESEDGAEVNESQDAFPTNQGIQKTEVNSEDRAASTAANTMINECQDIGREPAAISVVDVIEGSWQSGDEAEIPTEEPNDPNIDSSCSVYEKATNVAIDIKNSDDAGKESLGIEQTELVIAEDAEGKDATHSWDDTILQENHEIKSADGNSLKGSAQLEVPARRSGGHRIVDTNSVKI